MDHEEVGRYWDGNAEVWTEMVRAGYGHYRDGLNTPAFFMMLPKVEGLSLASMSDARKGTIPACLRSVAPS